MADHPLNRLINKVQLLNQNPQNQACLGMLPEARRQDPKQIYSVGLALMGLEALKTADYPEMRTLLPELEGTLMQVLELAPEQQQAALWAEDKDGEPALSPAELAKLTPEEAGTTLLQNLL